MAGKEYTTLPMQSLSVDEKHDPIHGHASGHSSEGPVSQSNGGSVLPGANLQKKPERKMHPLVIIVLWILISMTVILYNAWILKKEGLGFSFPIFLTTWHMASSTIATRILARTTHMLDGLNNIEMTTQTWVRTILPIGVLFSASLATSNMAVITLSVAYVQMVKAFMPVAVLFISIAVGIKKADTKQILTVLAISFGVALASVGELHFVLTGFILQVLAIAFESSRLVLIQILLQGMKMDPLVSLYYFAPVCAAILAMVLPFFEGLQPFYELGRVGPFILLTNAAAAFSLNFAAVMLIGAASSLALTLAGVVKDVTMIAGAVILMGSEISGLQLLGYAIALSALAYFKTL